MRLFALIALVFLTNATMANADPVTKEMAGRYYQSCTLKEASQKLSKESQEFLCACTASKMMDNMTTDDIAAMSVQDESGRKAMNYMIVKVYAPCMEYPAKDHYYNSCITNPKMKTLSRNPKGLCECMAGKVATHLGENGEAVFAGILNRNPNIIDPMSALESDPDFQSYVGKQVLSCIR